MSDDIHEQRPHHVFIGLFAAIAALIAWDLVMDYGEGADLRHVSIELLVLFAAAIGIALLWRRFDKRRTSTRRASRQNGGRNKTGNCCTASAARSRRSSGSGA